VLLFACAVAGLVTLINGPWLRVTAVAHSGGQYTASSALDDILDGYRGMPLLTVDSGLLQQRLVELPAVADAEVSVLLPGELRVTVTEKAPAFVWRTGAVQLIGAADGSVIAELPLSSTPSDELRALPTIEDSRMASRGLTIGDVLPAAELRTGQRLLDLDPDLIGSRARQLTVSITDEFGFQLQSTQPAWVAALGFYELDPAEQQAEAESRLEQQLAAIRTLFGSRQERAISWLDVRNTGKVYWTP
jgi:hypothetical protein